MHLRQPGFTYSACDPLTKDKEIMQRIKPLQPGVAFLYPLKKLWGIEKQQLPVMG